MRMLRRRDYRRYIYDILILKLRININNELLISVMNIHVNALSHRERILKKVIINNIS